MRRLVLGLLALLGIATCGIVAVWTVEARPAPTPDVAALNDAVHLAQAAWPEVAASTFARVREPLTVVDVTDRVLASTSSSAPTSRFDAAQQRALVAPVVVDGRVVGMVYLLDAVAANEAASRGDVAIAATVAIAAATLGVAGVALWLQLSVVRPFQALRSFATRVAAGDLEAPLAMDRGNVFGAWTESFDLLRTELASARQRELATRESKQALVAQISHDVRTPVASIAATTELLRAQITDPVVASRLDVIRAKTAQLDTLVTDLFRANADELAALQVVPADVPATVMAQLVRDADYQGRAQVGAMPECLVRIDPARLAQVFDNVLGNSYKYADTPISVTATLAGPLVELAFTDSGPGVPAAELGALFNRGVRGSNVGDRPGHGLGLFTSAWLMERMGGEIGVRQGSEGFTITVGVPLA